VSKKYITANIKLMLEQDLLTGPGRLIALQEIARIAMAGYVREVVVQKTGQIEPALVQDPATAIAAIRAIDSLSVIEESGLTVNITVTPSNVE